MLRCSVISCTQVAAPLVDVAAFAIVQETDLYDPRTQWASYLINALKAKELQKRNVNYIVRGEEVSIMDLYCEGCNLIRIGFEVFNFSAIKICLVASPVEENLLKGILRYVHNSRQAASLYLLTIAAFVSGRFQQIAERGSAASQVVIVDEFTGRTMPGRRWGDGLHQAIEAKERLPIQNETVTLASISYQVRPVCCLL